MFVFSALFSMEDVQPLKDSVQKYAPTVKSSHRCEALARGLGFQTYASLLASLKSQCAVRVTVTALSYRSYLSEHGFEAGDVSIYRAVGKVALCKVLADHPELTADGMGVYARGTWGQESLEDYRSRISEGRAQMFDDKSDERFLLACAFVQRIPKARTIREGMGYRRMKHIAEKMAAEYPDGTAFGPQYLPAGFLAAAAIHEGFKWKKFKGMDGLFGPEMRFNMRKTAIDELR